MSSWVIWFVGIDVSSLRLVLPAYTRLPHLRDVVGKLAGEPWVLDKPSGETVFTGTQGPLRSLGLSPAPVDEADPIARAWLSFRAADGMRRNWEVCAESDQEEGRIILTESTPLTVAIARRLIEFFGGRLRPGAADQGIVEGGAAIYGRPRPGGSPRVRPAEFQTQLAILLPLQADEVEAAGQACSDPSADVDACQALLLRARRSRGPRA